MPPSRDAIRTARTRGEFRRRSFLSASIACLCPSRCLSLSLTLWGVEPRRARRPPHGVVAAPHRHGPSRRDRGLAPPPAAAPWRGAPAGAARPRGAGHTHRGEKGGVKQCRHVRLCAVLSARHRFRRSAHRLGASSARPTGRIPRLVCARAHSGVQWKSEMGLRNLRLGSASLVAPRSPRLSCRAASTMLCSKHCVARSAEIAHGRLGRAVLRAAALHARMASIV